MALAENQVTLEVVKDGATGPKGDDGKSAYESAVDGGYQGTEQDFNEDLGTFSDAVNHFWTDEDGAHVTEVTQEEYLDDPTNAGGNTLITAGGMSIRKGDQTLLSTDEDSIDFYTYDEDSDTFIPSASLTANKMTFFNSGGEIGLNVISGLGDNVLGLKADGGVFIGDESAYRAPGHGAFIHTGTSIVYDDSPTIHLYARTHRSGGGNGSSNLAGIEIVASDTYTPSSFVEIHGVLSASPIRSNGYETDDGAELGSHIKLKGEDNETITLGTSDKYPAMKKLVEKKGNAFSHNTTNNCIECLYDGTIIVQAKIRLGGNYTAQDTIGYGLYNMDEDTIFAASQFRVPPNMTAPNQDVFTMAMPVVVSAGDRIRIRIRNATGARGRVQNDNTVISATFIAPSLS